MMRILPQSRSSSAPAIRLQFSKRWSVTIQASALILCSLGFLLLCTFQYLRTVSYRDPTSKFFDPARAYEKVYSQQRIDEVESFLADNDSRAEPSITKHVGPPKVCIGMTTFARRGDQYLNLTLGSLVSGLTYETRWPIFLNVLVAHTEPSKHPDWQKSWLHKLPDQLLTYEKARADIRAIKTWENEGRLGTKTIHDYALVMKDCYATGAQYILMVEDDVLAADDWYNETMKALGRIEKAMQTRLSERWVYLRLFYVDGFLGWNSEQWPDYLLWSFVTWAVLTGGMFMARQQSPQYRYYCTVTTSLVLSIIFIPAGILLFFMAGRLTTWPPVPGIHEMNNYGCCSQSLVFPRHIIPDLLEKMDPATNSLVDMTIEQISDQEGWIRWAIVPSVVQHIGSISSKGHAFDGDAKKLWSFRFEERTQAKT